MLLGAMYLESDCKAALTVSDCLCVPALRIASSRHIPVIFKTVGGELPERTCFHLLSRLGALSINLCCG
jgi:hypothetical protein